jgi:hypothetical protein
LAQAAQTKILERHTLEQGGVQLETIAADAAARWRSARAARPPAAA